MSCDHRPLPRAESGGERGAKKGEVCPDNVESVQIRSPRGPSQPKTRPVGQDAVRGLPIRPVRLSSEKTFTAIWGMSASMYKSIALASMSMAAMIAISSPALANWSFSGSPSPNAFIQTDKMTLELQCDRIRFAPAGYEDAQDIERKQGLSIRFMKDGATEVGAFQAGAANSEIRIVDNYPVEIVFFERSDYDFILDQIAGNAVLNLSMIDQDVSYGIFDLKGSGSAIKSLRGACSPQAASGPASIEAPEGIVYCGGGQIKRQIEYAILATPQDQWDVRVTINGKSMRAMTAYSYFGNSKPPQGFVVALLGEDRSEMLVFSDAGKDWLEFGDYTYRKCN